MNHQRLDTQQIDHTSFLAISRQYLGLQASPVPAEQRLISAPVATAKPNPPRKSMNNYRRLAQSVLLATGLGAFLAAPVFAEPNCGAMGGHEAHAEQHAKMMEQHHKQLHDALKLTAEQEPGWKKLMDSEQPKPSTSGAAKPEDWSKLTTPERAEKMLELNKARQEHMAEYVAALKGFYASLSAEQKKIFEEMHASQQGGMRGKSGMRHPGAGVASPKP